MKKKCPECGKTFEKLEFNVCPICIEPLIDVAERSELPKGRKFEVFERDNYSCQICGASRKTGAEITLDHIIPLSAGIINGGTHEMNNLQTLCKECNQNKADLIFKNILQYSIELKQLKINTLEREIDENKEKLNNATDENDLIEYSFKIKRIEEQLPILSKELTELKIKYHEEQEQIRRDKEKQEKQELLFKKLYVELSPKEKLVLKENFDLNELSDEDMLKALCSKYSEKEILGAIEDYKKELHHFLDDSLKFNMLPLISSELCLNNDSKPFIINHLYNNFTKTQVCDLLESVNNELFNHYDLSFNSIEKSLLKRYYSLNNASDSELINFVIKNDFSTDELKNTVESSYKNVFQEFYNKLDDNQKELVKFRFKNSKKNLVNFLAGKNFSSKELNAELDNAKLELFNKTYNSLNSYEKSLIERYSEVYSKNFDLIDFFYENKFSDEIMDALIERSEKSLIVEVRNNLNDHEMFLMENTFEDNDDLTRFMVEHQYSLKSLMKKLGKTEKRIATNLNKSLTDKDKFILKKHFSIGTDTDLIIYLIDHKYTVTDSIKMAHNYYNEFYEDFDKNLNHDYEQILYEKFSLSVNSKKELIDYLIFENYSVDSMKSLIKKDMYDKFSSVLDTHSTSILCYKFKLVTPTKISPIPLKEYLFDNGYTVYSVRQSIGQSKKELSNELDEKLDYQTVYLLNKQLKLPNSKNNLISHLVENCTVELIREMLKDYDIII